MQVLAGVAVRARASWSAMSLLPSRVLLSRAPQSQTRPTPLVLCRAMASASTASVLSLDTLQPNHGAKRQRKRVGRGRGSGMGKTSRRGHKGQGQRSGYSLGPGFEGGQMPLKKRIPKYGAWSNAQFRLDFNLVSIGRILYFIDRGLLDPTQQITMKHMHDAGVLKVRHPGVKLLSDGHHFLSDVPPLDIQVSRASGTAVQAIEDAGGKVETVYLNRLGLRAHIHPQKFHPALMPRRATIPYSMQRHYPFETHGHLYRQYQLTGPDVDRKTGKLREGAMAKVELGRGHNFSKWLSHQQNLIAEGADGSTAQGEAQLVRRRDRVAGTSPRSRKAALEQRIGTK